MSERMGLAKAGLSFLLNLLQKNFIFNILKINYLVYYFPEFSQVVGIQLIPYYNWLLTRICGLNIANKT